MEFGKIRKKFDLELCSNLDYEEMIVTVLWEIENVVAIISQEDGYEKRMIEIKSPQDKLNSWKFPLEDFTEALEKAKKWLDDTKTYTE